MHPAKKVQICLVLNFALLSVIITFMITFASNSKYFRFGPNDDFVLISVPINTNEKYGLLLFLIACMNSIKVLVGELGEPVLIFNVYNPDKKVITEFSKGGLLFYANSMFFVSNTRRVFDVMITVTQIDIALYSVIVEQLVSIITVYLLVSEKKFRTRSCNMQAIELEDMQEQEQESDIKMIK